MACLDTIKEVTMVNTKPKLANGAIKLNLFTRKDEVK
jgi:hypothetical protein